MSGMPQNRVGTTCALGNRLLVSRRVLECVIDRVAVSVHRVEVANSIYVRSADPCVVSRRVAVFVRDGLDSGVRISSQCGSGHGNFCLCASNLSP